MTTRGGGWQGRWCGEAQAGAHRTERVGHHGYPDTSHHYCSCCPPWRRRLVRPRTLVLGGRQGAPVADHVGI
jgi:hypothetical protein